MGFAGKTPYRFVKTKLKTAITIRRRVLVDNVVCVEEVEE